MELTTLIMKSFEEDATKALFELTAKSVMSPFKTNKIKKLVNWTGQENVMCL